MWPRTTTSGDRLQRMGVCRRIDRFPFETAHVAIGETAFAGHGEQVQPAIVEERPHVVLTNHAPMRDALTPFIAHRLAEQQTGLIGTPTRLDTNGKADFATLIANHPVVLPTPNSSIRIDFDALVGRLGIDIQIAAEVDDMAMMRLLTREGVWLGVLPPIVVQDELAAGTLVQALELPDITETFYAVTTKRRFPNPLLGALLHQDV